jgi:hypothetical protein
MLRRESLNGDTQHRQPLTGGMATDWVFLVGIAGIPREYGCTFFSRLFIHFSTFTEGFRAARVTHGYISKFLDTILRTLKGIFYLYS